MEPTYKSLSNPQYPESKTKIKKRGVQFGQNKAKFTDYKSCNYNAPHENHPPTQSQKHDSISSLLSTGRP